MHSRSTRGMAALGIALALAATSAVAANAAAPTSTGPSSSQSPYLVPTAPGISTRSLITVGDSADNGYRMVGIPDGLGAYDNGDGTITLVMNHELGKTAGVVRAHGSKGSFVSKWTIRKADQRVLAGEDLIHTIKLWDAATQTWISGTTAIDRLCSADLPPLSAFYNSQTGKGFNGRLFMNGEESDSGRAFAHGMDGTSYQFVDLGHAGWENVVANPHTGDKTVVVGLDDSAQGQLYVHVGDKKSSGSPLEKAGLTGGTLFGIKAGGSTQERDNPAFHPTTFGAVSLGQGRDYADTAALQAASEAKGVTEWWRPEDGAWDVNDHNVFYFNTTASFDGPSRLWKLTFVDASRPELGGKVEALLDGSEGQHMLDNMAAASDGKRLILNEDPGNQPYLASIYNYNLRTDRKTKIAQLDPQRFAPGGSAFITQDEESSGTIDASAFFGRGQFLVTTQAHKKLTDPELVEDGQLQVIRAPRVDAGNGLS